MRVASELPCGSQRHLPSKAHQNLDVALRQSLSDRNPSRRRIQGALVAGALLGQLGAPTGQRRALGGVGGGLVGEGVSMRLIVHPHNGHATL